MLRLADSAGFSGEQPVSRRPGPVGPYRRGTARGPAPWEGARRGRRAWGCNRPGPTVPPRGQDVRHERGDVGGHVKVPTRARPQPERAGGDVGPPRQPGLVHQRVAVAVIAADRARQRLGPGAGAVGRVGPQVRAQRRRQHLAQLRVLRDPGVDAAQGHQAVPELIVGGLVDVPVIHVARGHAGGRTQPHRLPADVPQQYGGLVRHHRAQTVPEQHLVHPGPLHEFPHDVTGQLGHVVHEILAEPVAAPGVLDGQQLHSGRQRGRPVPERERRAPGVGEAHQTDGGSPDRGQGPYPALFSYPAHRSAFLGMPNPCQSIVRRSEACHLDSRKRSARHPPRRGRVRRCPEVP